MKNIVIFSGAGISAESGLKTFRDSGGLWEKYSVDEVATPEAWAKNPKKVLEFYNLRRKQVLVAKPNKAHVALVELEQYYKVKIITQNIDDLHERAGSTNILHVHGEILKARSIVNENEKHKIITLNYGDYCSNNKQLRPDVVWFGEPVPNMDIAIEICETADVLIIIGTSLNVYPAANIVNHVTDKCKKYLIDPKEVNKGLINNIEIIKEKASIGIPMLVKKLIATH